METRKITRHQTGIVKTNLTTGNNILNQISTGSFNPDSDGFAFPTSALYDAELMRLNDIKSHFVSLATDKTDKPGFLFDKVWASAKALGQYLKMNKLK